MKHLRVLIALLFVTAIALPAFFSHIVTSQAQDPGAQAPQADRVSDTGFPVTPTDDSRFGPSCGADIPCEGSNPFDNSTFTFSAADGERPPGADQCPIRCPPPMMCPEPICEDPPHAEEAPADFSTDSNGFADDRTHADDLVAFDTFEVKDDGLGPVYNAQACRECHQNPVSGAISQITELRAGHMFGPRFVDAPGGSLINDRAINAKVQERVPPLFSALVFTRLTRLDGGIDEIRAYPSPSPAPSPSPIRSPSPIPGEEPIRTFRTSLNLLGDGFVEAIPNGTLQAISRAQSELTGGVIHGAAIVVPVLEANVAENRDCADSASCKRRVGRFGWKNQIPSLLTFSGDAYLNEMGITNFLVINENSSLGRPVSAFDDVPDDQDCREPVEFCRRCKCGEDVDRDVDAFANFMRATKAPPQDLDVQEEFADDIRVGRQLFTQMPGLNYSCSACHVPAILTAQPDTVINQGFMTVDTHLGFKIIRPFSDFLLHDIGTGDGIEQNGGSTTRLKLRTAPLWGVRTRTRLMHDGSSTSPTGSSTPPAGASFTFMEAILRHQGEAAAVTAHFQLLTDDQKRKLIMFLESL